MSTRSFRSVFMVASCAGAALGCYLVSLRVASERAALENVETEIVLAQRDIRLLQTEIGTRGRLAQLERWNVKVLALSAPSADQFLDGGFALAKMVAPRGHKVDLDAPVVLAAAPATRPKPQLGRTHDAADDPDEGVSASDMMHVASLKRTVPPVRQVAEAEQKPALQRPAATKPATKVATKPAGKATASVKPPSTPKTKPPAADRKTAAVDPLAPIASSTAKPKKLASATSQSPRKENGSKQ